MTRNVVIGVPSYRGGHSSARDAVFLAMHEIGKRPGWSASLAALPGNSMIPYARNTICSDFLAGEGTDLIFYDDDNWCDPSGILALLDAQADVVGAAVRSRRDPITWNLRWKQQPIARKNGLIEVETIGTGITRITRNCLEQLSQTPHIKDRWYKDRGAKVGRAFPFFEYEIQDHCWWGEDTLFCRRWQAMGGTIWVHPDIVTHHIGDFDYCASLAGWLASMPPRIELHDPAHIDNALHGPPPVTVSYCIATRGRPALLRQSVTTLLANSVRDETRIVIAYDDDDPQDFIADRRVIVSNAPREDSLGDKYNRCQRAASADIYVLGCDDTTVPTLGWDAILASAARHFPDGYAVLYFGKLPGVFQPGIAVTGKLVEKMGFLCQPYTPFWWQDTWIDEVGQMIGRIVGVENVAIEQIGDIKQSRGARDIAFWGQLFDRLRPVRAHVARQIIASADFAETPERKRELLERIAPLCEELHRRNHPCSDPASAAELEKQFGFDAPDDERYRRIKAAALRAIGQQTLAPSNP